MGYSNVAVSCSNHPFRSVESQSNQPRCEGCANDIQVTTQPSNCISANRAILSYVLVTLATDRWRIVNEEVAWTASGIVWISHSCCRWATGLGLGMMWISAVTDVTLIIGSTTLPANGAWAASGSYTALVAIAAKMTAS